jgi:hypothetical protein
VLGRTRFAPDPRDYIYAFLGIGNLGVSNLPPDYKKNLLSISIDTFQCIFEETGNLDILSACRQYGTQQEFDEAVAGNWPT